MEDKPAQAAKSEVMKGDKLVRQGGTGSQKRNLKETSLGVKAAAAAKSEIMKGDKLGREAGSGSQERFFDFRFLFITDGIGAMGLTCFQTEVNASRRCSWEFYKLKNIQFRLHEVNHSGQPANRLDLKSALGGSAAALKRAALPRAVP